MKWYEFTQNNSGGGFVENDTLCHRVYIQAFSAGEANRKAQEMGIYFDGIEAERDCPCCGDRWCEAYDEREFPVQWGRDVVFNTIEEYTQFLANKYGGWTSPDSRLYYADGTVVEIFTQDNKV